MSTLRVLGQRFHDENMTEVGGGGETWYLSTISPALCSAVRTRLLHCPEETPLLSPLNTYCSFPMFTCITFFHFILHPQYHPSLLTLNISSALLKNVPNKALIIIFKRFLRSQHSVLFLPLQRRATLTTTPNLGAECRSMPTWVSCPRQLHGHQLSAADYPQDTKEDHFLNLKVPILMLPFVSPCLNC